jgi:hypothetical protein
VRIERPAGSANQFSTITIGVPVDFTGTQIELRGFLKTEDSGFAGLWLRKEGESAGVAFDNMQNRTSIVHLDDAVVLNITLTWPQPPPWMDWLTWISWLGTRERATGPGTKGRR